MTKPERSPKLEIRTKRRSLVTFCPRVLDQGFHSFLGIRISDLIRHSDFVIRHSYLSASIGSTFVARLAGSQLARTATRTSNNTTLMNVTGSVGVTP